MEKLFFIDNIPFKKREKSYYKANNINPNARDNERNELLNLIDFNENHSFVDLQSASGYLAEGIKSRWPLAGKIICVEPSEKLSCFISNKFEVINKPLESTGIPDESIDVVVCLAGIHHSESLDKVVQECYRVLKPKGQCILSDVEIYSRMDFWLNEFVHMWTPSGHNGNFVKLGDFSKSFASVGMNVVLEKRLNIPWKFKTTSCMEEFIYTIFGLNIKNEDIFKKGIKKYLKYSRKKYSVELDWSLIYSKAIK